MATALMVMLGVLPACSSPPAGGPERSPLPSPTRSPRATPSDEAIPPIPSEQGGASGSAPVVWVGGTLAEVSPSGLTVEEAIGPTVVLDRLGQDATTFFRPTGGAWERVDSSEVEAGGQACVETLLDGQNLLALRVFLGADCGPSG